MKILILGHEYDKFILGTEPSGEKTLVHLGQPQFVCKIAESPTEIPEDDFIYMLPDGRTLHSLALSSGSIDSIEDFSALMAEAQSSIQRITE